MMVFAIGIEFANVPVVYRSHDANSRKHLRPVVLDHQYQRLDRGLAIPAAPIPLSAAR
ncbi:hypothetical protein [Bradyrhizobium sp. AZCC 2289]|uniref:hypothetical protein n=1 Tax=Bradyrhizobium sp. AZCC 2289 TaxID=3117026 RepID=UPI002FF28A16